MWHPLPRQTYLYNIIHENAKLIKKILFNKHKRVHVGKNFTSTLIIKLKTYQSFKLIRRRNQGKRRSNKHNTTWILRSNIDNHKDFSLVKKKSPAMRPLRYHGTWQKLIQVRWAKSRVAKSCREHRVTKNKAYKLCFNSSNRWILKLFI